MKATVLPILCFSSSSPQQWIAEFIHSLLWHDPLLAGRENLAALLVWLFLAGTDGR
jgi:hypothetical protein